MLISQGLKYFYKKFPNFIRSRADGPLKSLLTLVRQRPQFPFQHENTSPELSPQLAQEAVGNQLKIENENRKISPSYRIETIINTCFNEEIVFSNIDYETYQMLCNNKQYQQKALFIGRELPLNFKEAFEQLHYDLTFLIPKSEEEDWIKFLPNSYQSHQDAFNLANPSPGQIQKIKDHNFDMYIISYGTRINWGDVTIEQYIGNFTHSFILIHPRGNIRIYDRWDDFMRINYNKSLLGTMFKYIPNLKDKKILDIGCSDGMVEDLLLNEDPDTIVGIDIMDDVGCNYKDTKITYYKMDACELNFEENSFDLCFSIAVLEHCNDPFLVLQKIKKVIKKGGYCFIQSAPIYFSPFGHHMFGYFDNYPWIHLRLSKDEIIDYCKRNNLEVQSERSSNSRIEDYIYGMLNDDHINGKLFKEYKIEEFISQPDIEVLYYSRSYEGENLLTKEIINELKHYPEVDLISHGFALVFKVK